MKRAACLLLLPALAACAGGEPPRDEGRAGGDASARLEVLRALPYVDFAGSEGDGGGDGVVRVDRELSAPGYTLAMSRTLCRSDLMERGGRVVHTWRHAPCHHWANTTLLEGGDLLVVGMDPPREDDAPDRLEDRYLMRLGWDGEVIWKRRIPVHHDAQPAPGGRITAILARHRREPRFDAEIDLRDNGLALLSAGGEILEEISLYELLAPGPAGFRLERAGVERAERLGAIDLLHANTVHWMPWPGLEGATPLHALENVMVTIRNQDTVAIIHWPTREVLWTWGRGEILGPHDATWLASGNILVFDNGLGREWSRVVELDPLERRIVWEFTAPDREAFYSASRGGAQRLSNGNTLVTESDRGHAFEVTPGGSVVWEFWNPNRNEEGRRATIFRVRRYGSRAVAGLLDGGATRRSPEPSAAPGAPGR